MPPLINLAYLVGGAAAVIAGIAIWRLLAARGAHSEKRVSQLTGYSAIFAILSLWGVGFMSLGAGAGLNPNLLNMGQ